MISGKTAIFRTCFFMPLPCLRVVAFRLIHESCALFSVMYFRGNTGLAISQISPGKQITLVRPNIINF